MVTMTAYLLSPCEDCSGAASCERAAVRNLRRELRRLLERLQKMGIAYGFPEPEAMNLLEEAAKENDEVLDNPSPTVAFLPIYSSRGQASVFLLGRRGYLHRCSGLGTW
jgi:hypothetical protein